MTARLAPALESLSPDELFDLKCIRIRNEALAAQGCGDPRCDVNTCAVARHARVTLKAILALVGPADVRPSGRVRTHT